MYTEQTGTGFFSRLKSVFSQPGNTHRTEAEAEDSPVATQAIAEDIRLHDEIAIETAQTMNGYFDRAESVTEKEISLRTVEVSAPTYLLPDEKDLDIRFATAFTETGGKFIFCESLKDAVSKLEQLKEENGWSHIFCWENEIKDAFNNYNFQKGILGFTIENSDAAASLCESLIADEGIIILNPKQASRRRLPCFPKTHIIITDVAHLTGTGSIGFDRFKQLHKGELPSVIKLGACNNGHFYDKQRLILNAEGPEDIYVFLVDEVIPPSLRP